MDSALKRVWHCREKYVTLEGMGATRVAPKMDERLMKLDAWQALDVLGLL